MPRQYTRSTTLLDNTVDMPTASATIEATNPANSQEQRDEGFVQRRKRVPMNNPTRKLETPELPGYYLHWVNGEPDRIAKALRAEYDFVQTHELPGYTLELGDQTGISGSGDMGSRISVIAGGSDTNGQALRLYLMKLPIELREEDLDQRDEEGQKVIDALRNDPGAQAVSGQDNSSRYTPKMRDKSPPKPKSLCYNALDAFQKRR